MAAAPALRFPLSAGFFPQMVLTVDELMQYRRLSKARVLQLVRIIDDADCVYCWTDVKARTNRCVQRAKFVDMDSLSTNPTTTKTQRKPKQPSTWVKCSAHLVDVQPEEILGAIAKVKTRDARRVMTYLHGDEFVDTRTLLTFPSSSDVTRPRYAYRAIKWCLLEAKRRVGPTGRRLDFCYLEYAGTCKTQETATTTTSLQCGVVGFCVQESIGRDRQVPTLERYEIQRGQLIRSGFVITRTHQSNILKVTAIAQISGAMEPTAVRMTMEEIMVDYVAVVHRIKGLLERQRMGRLRFLDDRDLVASKDRKACAVCLRGFYFHRKHHCATCGEVVCSTCAPLRELDEPLDKQTRSMRVCSVCMAQAGSRRESNVLSGLSVSANDRLESATCTTNVGTDTYVGSLRYPKDQGGPSRKKSSDEFYLGSSLSPSTPVRSPLPPFQARHHPMSNRQSRGDVEDASNVQSLRAAPDRAQRSSEPHHFALCSSALPAHAKRKTLDALVEHDHQACDTTNKAILEAEAEAEYHGMFAGSDCGDASYAERYDASFERMMRIRETLNTSSSDLEVLKSMGHCDLVCPSDAHSDWLDSDLAFSISEGTSNEHTSAIGSESIELYSSQSSLLSVSEQSLDHQDPGELLPSPTPQQDSSVREARALEEAMQWVRQSEPTARLGPFRPAPSITMPTNQTVPDPLAEKASAETLIGSVKRNAGTERLAHKIKCLRQRVQVTQRKSQATSSGPIAVVAGPVTSTFLAVPAAMDERNSNANDELEPENELTPHESAVIPALKQSRVPAVAVPLNDKQAVSGAQGALSFSSQTAPREFDLQSARLSDPSRAPRDLVARLRDVMNSSELTLAPQRRRPGTGDDVASVIETPSSSSSLPSAPASRNAFPGISRRAVLPSRSLTSRAVLPVTPIRSTAMVSTAPKAVHGSTIYVCYNPEDRFQKVDNRKLDQRFSTTIEARCTPHDVRGRTKDKDDEHNRQDNHVSSLHEEQAQVHCSAALPPVIGSCAERRVRICDESGELRELMEVLAKAPLRSRCSSGQSTGAPSTEKVDL